MPEFYKQYPHSIEEWKEATPEEVKLWILRIADEHLWRVDDVAYTFLSSIAILLEKQGWQYGRTESTQKEATVSDEVVIDVRKFAAQKAREILSFDIIDSGDEAKELIKAAKKIEKYILGTD